jgi:2-methylcitrate dehydratase PrpD
MGKWLSEQRWSTIPVAARQAARLQILNMVAAVHASASSRETLTMLTGMRWGAGDATVLATGERLAPADAAFVNAAFSMAQDFDDIIWIGHTCHSAVFAALAVAEAEGKSAEDLIGAVVVANEIAGRIGGSTFFGPLNGQMWTFIHLVGGAAATAYLLGLDAERSAHALAIAMSQPPFALQAAFFTPTSKFLAASIPTQIGVQAGYYARAGMTGAIDILEDKKGFWKWFAFRPLPGVLTDLGKWWAIQSLAIKTYPCCNYFQTACTLIESAIGKRRPTSPDQIERLTIHTNKLGFEATRFAREYAGAAAPLLTPVGVGFDLGLCAAVLLHAGKLTGDECEPEWLRANADALRRWYARVEVVHDPALTLRVLDSAWQIEAGRDALRQLSPIELLRLARSYREHYGSTLLDPRDLVGWVRAALDRIRGQSAAAPAGDFLPIYFPNRIHLRHADGMTVEDQLDLQTGSTAAPTMPAVLERKFVHEVGIRIGAERARAAYRAGLELGTEPLAQFVARLIPAGAR